MEMYHQIILWISLMIANVLAVTDVPEINRDLNFPIRTLFNRVQQLQIEGSIAEQDANGKTVYLSPNSSGNLNPMQSIYQDTSRSEWIMTGPGEINVPILLYHHVFPCPTPNWLETDMDLFEFQMRYLGRHGYQTITTMQLREAILQGAVLPPKPVIITFDDGNENIFKYAFPIMERYGLKGTIYVITERLGYENFVSVDQLKELSAVGWEIGSHTITHADLTTLSPSQLEEELLGSRLRLEEVLGMEIHSIAYPYGLFNSEVANSALKHGYITAMGLGLCVHHGSYSLFYLNRQPIDGPDALEEFLLIYKRSANH
jgi:peptidoglycan/xylan/chitin deacetylase (PgdA/CDA1 family)